MAEPHSGPEYLRRQDRLEVVMRSGEVKFLFFWRNLLRNFSQNRQNWCRATLPQECRVCPQTLATHQNKSLSTTLSVHVHQGTARMSSRQVPHRLFLNAIIT